jgi:hypothetical protein
MVSLISSLLNYAIFCVNCTDEVYKTRFFIDVIVVVIMILTLIFVCFRTFSVNDIDCCVIDVVLVLGIRIVVIDAVVIDAVFCTINIDDGTATIVATVVDIDGATIPLVLIRIDTNPDH